MKLEEIHKDWRGTTNILKLGDKELAIITKSVDGAVRGGHWHPYDTTIIVIEGAIDYILTENPEKPEESKVTRYDSINNPIITTPKNIPHVAVSVGESIMLELKGPIVFDEKLKKYDIKYEIYNYPPYRKFVDMGKPMNVEEVLKILKS